MHGRGVKRAPGYKQTIAQKKKQASQSASLQARLPRHVLLLTMTCCPSPHHRNATRSRRRCELAKAPLPRKPCCALPLPLTQRCGQVGRGRRRAAVSQHGEFLLVNWRLRPPAPAPGASLLRSRRSRLCSRRPSRAQHHLLPASRSASSKKTARMALSLTTTAASGIGLLMRTCLKCDGLVIRAICRAPDLLTARISTQRRQHPP